MSHSERAGRHRTADHADRRPIVPAGGDGERVSPDYPNDLFHAHLSIYRFAWPHAVGGRVLDAGCGTGYGAAYLAARGAGRVWAIDRDPLATRLAARTAPRAAVACLDLEHADALGAATFDLVVCSNVLEHVPDVERALRALHRVLAPSGVLVLAVPPVPDHEAAVREWLNPHHLHAWPACDWAAALRVFFGRVTAWRHVPAAGTSPDFLGEPSPGGLDENDFEFVPAPDGWRGEDTLTALLLAEHPRDAADLPQAGSGLPLGPLARSRRPPGGREVPLAVVTARPTAAWRLVPRAAAHLRRGGPAGLLRQARSYLRFLALRREGRRLLAGLPCGEPPVRAPTGADGPRSARRGGSGP